MRTVVKFLVSIMFVGSWLYLLVSGPQAGPAVWLLNDLVMIGSGAACAMYVTGRLVRREIKAKIREMGQGEEGECTSHME